MANTFELSESSLVSLRRPVMKPETRMAGLLSHDVAVSALSQLLKLPVLRLMVLVEWNEMNATIEP